MMKKTRTLSFLALFISLAFFFMSYADNPPDGNTGAPGDGLCSNAYCHGSNPGSFTGNVVISGLPSTVSPSVTYPITITINNFNGGAVKAGFQLVALDDNANNMGTITGNAEVASTTVANGRNYAEHDPAKNFVGSVVSYTFDWTAPNGTGENITMYAAGNIANGNGSTSGDVIVTSTASTVVGTSLLLDITSTSISCFASIDGTMTVTASGGVPGYTYLWSDGQTNSTAVGLSAGAYAVTVTDSNSTTATVTGEVTEPAPMTIEYTATNATGFGLADGEIVIVDVTGGFPPYTYQWSNGGTTSTITDLSEGEYTVTVIDDYGCSVAASAYIWSPELLEVMIVNVGGDINEGGTGEITIEVTGGVAPYMYSWEDSEGNVVSTEMNPTGLPAGSYRLFITDANGNTVESESIEVEALVDVVDLSLSSQISLSPNPAQDEINLEIENIGHDAQVIIMDVRGQTISKKGLTTGNNRINTSLFVEGIYFFRVQIADRFVVKKVVVRK